MKKRLIFLAQNDFEANLIKTALSEQKIDSFILGGSLQSFIGEVPVDAGYSKIYVNEIDYITAKNYIEEYKLIQKNDLSETSICKNCKEMSPSSFTICWKCEESIKI